MRCQTEEVLSSLSVWAVVSSFVNGQHDLCYKGVNGESGRSPWPAGCPWQPIPSLLASGVHSQGWGLWVVGTHPLASADSGEEHPGLLSTYVPEQHGVWADSEPTLCRTAGKVQVLHGQCRDA